MRITLDQARTFLALLHFDDRSLPEEANPMARLNAVVRRLGCVQYDPLDVVGRNADLRRAPQHAPKPKKLLP